MPACPLSRWVFLEWHSPLCILHQAQSELHLKVILISCSCIGSSLFTQVEFNWLFFLMSVVGKKIWRCAVNCCRVKVMACVSGDCGWYKWSEPLTVSGSKCQTSVAQASHIFLWCGWTERIMLKKKNHCNSVTQHAHYVCSHLPSFLYV